MQRKFILVILVLMLIFFAILEGFSNFTEHDLSHDAKLVFSLESIQPKPEPTAEPTKFEQTASELTNQPEPEQVPEPAPEPTAEPTKFEQTESELTNQPEPEVVEGKLTEVEITQYEVSTEPEPTESESIPDSKATEPKSTPLITPTEPNFSPSVVNAIKFFEQTYEPEAILWLDVMHRRFGIEQFNNALEWFDELLYCFPNKSSARLFRRMADYNARINAEELKRVTNEFDCITLPALYCDRLDLPTNYSTVLQEGVGNGGYQLTHVLLAWIWIQENGVELELPDGFVEDMYHANAALINTDLVVTDLELEAAAFLCLAEQSELIDENFIEQVIANQDIDGGWGSYKRWHTTILGLMFLLHIESPSEAYPPILAPKPA